MHCQSASEHICREGDSRPNRQKIRLASTKADGNQLQLSKSAKFTVAKCDILRRPSCLWYYPVCNAGIVADFDTHIDISSLVSRSSFCKGSPGTCFMRMLLKPAFALGFPAQQHVNLCSCEI